MRSIMGYYNRRRSSSADIWHSADRIRGSRHNEKNAKLLTPDESAMEALSILRKYQVSLLIVIQMENCRGVIHLHDLLKKGFI